MRGKLSRGGGGCCPGHVSVFRSALRALVAAHRRLQISRTDAIAVATVVGRHGYRGFFTDAIAVAGSADRRDRSGASRAAVLFCGDYMKSLTLIGIDRC